VWLEDQLIEKKSQMSESMSESMSELENTRMEVLLEYLNGSKSINSAFTSALLKVQIKTASRLLVRQKKLEH